jgi:hypothetical protein
VLAGGWMSIVAGPQLAAMHLGPINSCAQQPTAMLRQAAKEKITAYTWLKQSRSRLNEHEQYLMHFLHRHG